MTTPSEGFHRRLHHQQDGAAATEFAIIVPILILLFFGIVYFGLSIFRQQVAEASAREGARVAAVGGDTSEVQAAVWNAADPAFVTGAGGEVAVTFSDTCDGSLGDTTTVDVLASGSRLNFTVPFFRGGGEITPEFRATATFECEKETS